MSSAATLDSLLLPSRLEANARHACANEVSASKAKQSKAKQSKAKQSKASNPHSSEKQFPYASCADLSGSGRLFRTHFSDFELKPT